MTSKPILILGGYGNVGLAIARLLVSQKKLGIILAGRNGERAQRAAQQFNTEFKTDCFSGLRVDAASKESLIQAFRQVGMVVVASSTIEFTQIVAEAALESGIDYFDIQISAAAKRQALEALQERVLSSGRCFITDGGYRPGIPAAMVRYAATQIPGLESAPVASVFQVKWKDYEFSPSSAAEFELDLKSFNSLVLKNGTWQPGKMSEMLDIDFSEPFGHKYCMPMFLEEFRPLPESIPSLKETGFYSGGFGSVFDYLILPMVITLLNIAPNRSRKLRARLVEWGLKQTTRPPYGAVLQMKAQGAGRSLVMTVFHEDSYLLTAAPAVACLLQYLDGSLQKPGLWRQATLVEPVRFFEDIARFGVQIINENC
jgi:saccharopine dehydrogenase (NAD+, L-lysine-forming)